ncbi:MAG: DNA primase catalytic subunit PriS [Candidatus Altiarchaeota archaeon]
MDINTRIYLKKKFQEYYSKEKIPAPREIEKREFGIGTLEKKIQIRHKSFSNEIELQNYLRREAPFFISYSSAYYEFPSNEPMSAKNFLYADLIFDLDISMDFFDEEKLKIAKNEVLNLRDFLLNDFGFSQQEISINFSGSKGYHVHVFSEKVKKLGSDERSEIIDYLLGHVDFNVFWYSDGVSIRGPKKTDTGWKGRVFYGLYNFIKNSDKKQFKSIPKIGEKKAEFLIANRERILTELENGFYDSLNGIAINFEMSDRSKKITQDPNIKYRIPKDEKISSKLIQEIVMEKAIKTLSLRDTDKMVTIDTSRLIRLPESLHGNSGLIAKKISDIDKFNPLEDAIAFSNENVKIQILQKIPEFDFYHGKVGPFFEGVTKIPEALAIYLLLRGYGNFLQ